MADPPANIILLIDDNHRVDHVGAFRGQVSTPAWDSIAVARGPLYITLIDGTLQCMGE